MKQDLHIRAIDSKIISVLDETAKEKNISRSKLIREILYNYVLFDDYRNIEENFREITKLNVSILKENMELLEIIKNDWNDDNE